MAVSKKILITGAGGQLGKCLQQCIGTANGFLLETKESLDITDANKVAAYFKQHKPNIVIHTAAYTQVDAAETNKNIAFAVNAEGVKNVAKACKTYKAVLLHVSTDYVFEGTAKEPYTPNMKPNPVTVYGKSKLEGERYILEEEVEVYAIIRTSWLYSSFAPNFYKTMLRLATANPEIRVVDDQLGSPTYAMHLAKALLKIAAICTPATNGIYHYSNSGTTSWYGFAKEIFKQKRVSVEVSPIPSSLYSTPAKRPAFSVLNTHSIQETFGLKIATWQDALQECVQEDIA